MIINNVCIFGGSGFIGRHLANLLTDQEIQLRVPTRNYERAKEVLVIPTVDLVEVTDYDDNQLDQLLMGMDAVINLIGVLHGDFHQAHVEMPQKIVAACHRADTAHERPSCRSRPTQRLPALESRGRTDCNDIRFGCHEFQAVGNIRARGFFN